jgi:lysophospholipase L1-like esterase
MTSTRPAARRSSVQNIPVSLLARLTLVCAAVLGGCAWDGPSVAVRVVPEATAVGGDDVTPDHGSTGSSTGGSDGATESASGDVRAPGADAATSGIDGAREPDSDIEIVPPFPTTVAVVGDSLTLSARDEITAELADLGLDVLVVDGVESRRMTAGSSARPSGLDAIRSIREEFAADPDLWVIALGTNDVGAQVDEDRFREDLRATIAGVGLDAPLVWVDIWIRDRRDAAVVANGVIRDEIAERSPPSGVVGWFAHGAGDGMVTGDGVHLTERGQAAFATAIVNQVRSIYRR